MLEDGTWYILWISSSVYWREKRETSGLLLFHRGALRQLRDDTVTHDLRRVHHDGKGRLLDLDGAVHVFEKQSQRRERFREEMVRSVETEERLETAART